MSDEIKKIATRDSYGNALAELGEEFPDFYVLDADLAGATKTVSVSLGNLNKDAFDADKAISIVSLLSPVLDKSIVTVEKVETSTVSQ